VPRKIRASNRIASRRRKAQPVTAALFGVVVAAVHYE
jgi:hypothetical protein